ncbi:putative WSC domain protein [Planoprotostelium fungivorum]|uniref:Putative WSC domain protein n=1 Tax=Planoprotostelium fungivorum TaxID=1890364 RepID=A0A2P6NK88_9EUKA|nr:putative WSC domain protein [Planoprotostelium fungivorum]
MRSLLSVCLIASLVLLVAADWNREKNEAPFWKVFCNSEQVFRGRLDSIVNPGTLSGHVHKVFGGSHFSSSVVGRTPLEEFAVTKSAPCTTCSIKEVDNSNYWTPDLYYRWPDGTYSLVPGSGLTVYYLSRRGSTGKNRTDPNWQPIPKGLRMLAGDPTRRNYDGSVKHKAISYVWYAYRRSRRPLTLLSLNYNGGGFQEGPSWEGLATNQCSNDNPEMGFGNNVRACPPLAPYVKGNNEPGCKLANAVPLTENLGISKPIKRMPGCWTSTGLLQGCDPSPKGSDNSDVYHIFSVSANAYLSIDLASPNVLANGSSKLLTYSQLWGFSDRPSGRVAIRSEESSKVISAQHTAQMVGRLSDREEWTIVEIAGSNSTVAFKSNRNNLYLSVAADKTLSASGKSISSAETFKLSNPDGGYVPKDDGFNGFVRALSVKPAIIQGSN